MTFNDKLKSNILRDFDKRLQTEVSMDLYSFIATLKLEVALISGHKDVRQLFRYTHLNSENVFKKYAAF